MFDTPAHGQTVNTPAQHCIPVTARMVAEELSGLFEETCRKGHKKSAKRTYTTTLQHKHTGWSLRRKILERVERLAVHLSDALLDGRHGVELSVVWTDRLRKFYTPNLIFFFGSQSQRFLFFGRCKALQKFF